MADGFIRFALILWGVGMLAFLTMFVGASLETAGSIRAGETTIAAGFFVLLFSLALSVVCAVCALVLLKE